MTTNNTATEFNQTDALASFDNDAELFRQLADVFVAGVPRYLAELDAALAASDADRLGRIAHTLKGLCATFAADAGQQASHALERATHPAQPERWADLASTLREHVAALAAALSRLQ